MKSATLHKLLFAFVATFMVVPAFAANHRSAPITALDNAIGIPDVFAFRSYGEGATDKVTFIMTVDPFREPGNGPVWFLFDPSILYQIKIDNNNDAVEDIVFQFRFSTEQRLPNLFQTYAGIDGGLAAPANSPVPEGTPIVPDRIDSFDDAGLGQLQTYKVTMLRNRETTKPKFKPKKPIYVKNADGSPFFVVPTNVGPRTMNYDALFTAGTYTNVVAKGTNGISVFAGIVDDPFWLDLGPAFDTLNLRATGFPAQAVLSDDQDDNDTQNFASDEFSGYSVMAIAIEVPITMLTRTGKIEAADSTAATIGMWATTSRKLLTIRRSPRSRDKADAKLIRNFGPSVQLQRMAFPLINELFIGIGFKDRFSMDQPKNDSQFVQFFNNPTLALILNAATGGLVEIPTPPADTTQPRPDLLPVFTYAPPIAAAGTPPGPIADLLRLNTGVPPTPVDQASRLGLLTLLDDRPLNDDPAGFPNGRRVFDDVTDVALRVVAGVLAGAPFNGFPNNRLGDGVNVNDMPYPEVFPYLADGQSGRDSRHVDPDEAGCDGQPSGICPIP